MSIVPGFFRRLLREPLLHFFAVLGGLIFGLLADPKTPGSVDAEGQIVISSAEVERMASAWTQRWQRPPVAPSRPAQMPSADVLPPSPPPVHSRLTLVRQLCTFSRPVGNRLSGQRCVQSGHRS